MSLRPGDRLGPYEVQSLIGAGGMGEVYKARDTRLDRTVAIKVLPPDLAADPERRQRFEREAKTISALNHPHICTLHDVGEEDGTAFLVMEHLEGETLAARLERGALPLDQALRLGADIADALASAHRHDIVHRDLKPGNVMLTGSGAKLLDFGLAKLKAGYRLSATGFRPEASATATESLTTEGKVLGTVPYMAPEQIEGKDTDARTDIFALGCVLYEMVTGQRAFAGDTSAALMSAILKDDPPPLAERQPLTPRALEHVVQTCLAKDPDRRWQSAADVGRELAWIAQQARTPAEPVSARFTGPRWLRGWQAVVLGLALGLGVGLVIARVAWLGRDDRPTAAGISRFVIQLPPDRRLDLSTRSVTISPDGRTVVYAALGQQGAGLYARSTDSLEARLIPGAEGGTNPFFSPDGVWLGFYSDGRLRKIPAGGGTPATVCPTGPLQGAAWSADDVIVFASGFPTSISGRPVPETLLRTGASSSIGLFRVPASGGEPELVARPDAGKGELSYRWPALLPDGHHVIFTIRTGFAFDAAHVGILALDDPNPRLLLPDATGAQVVGTDRLIFATAQGLSVAAVVGAAVDSTARPVPLVESVEVFRGGPQFSVSENGTLVYAEPRREILKPQQVSRAGVVKREWADMSGLWHISISPDGRRLGTTEETFSGMSLLQIDLERGSVSRFAGAGNNHMPIWNPDGRGMVFSSDRDGAANLYWQVADGSRPAERLLTSAQHQDPGSFSPDGRWLAYAEAHPERQWDLWIFDFETREAQPFRQTPATECFPLFSPDGRAIVYVSDESGRREVYLEAFPGGTKRVQVSVDGGDAPRWARDGRLLFYFSGDTLFEVPVETGDGVRVGRPAPLFRGPYHLANAWGIPSYDVMPDGSGFLMLRIVEEGGAGARLIVVQNWFEELKAKVPTGR